MPSLRDGRHPCSGGACVSGGCGREGGPVSKNVVVGCVGRSVVGLGPLGGAGLVVRGTLRGAGRYLLGRIPCAMHPPSCCDGPHCVPQSTAYQGVSTS